MIYIIDFERVNKLTVTLYDKESTTFSSGFAYSISRAIIKEYLEFYHQHRDSVKHPHKLEEVIETLRYNKILISPADIRDNKINDVLNGNVSI